MTNPHDAVFKDLISNHAFAVSFLRTYLPAELAEQINWDSVKLDAANVEHTRQQQKHNVKSKEQSDLAFLFRFNNGQTGACFVHIEQQTTNDKTLLMRVRHYQTAYLLDYIKRHKSATSLPLVVSIIYYANRKPFVHSLDIYDYFANQDLARKYAFSTQFVDINRFSDEEILNHGFIAGYELILKHIREQDIDGKLEMVAKQLVGYDHVFRQVLIRYMSQFSDMQPEIFYDKIIDSQHNLESDVMTVAEQIERKGLEKGIEKGIEQGMQQKTFAIAQSLIKLGLSDQKIIEATQIDQTTLDQLRQQIQEV